MKTLIRNSSSFLGNFMPHGWGNGYVLIPIGHPLHGVQYDAINVDVHGGLTFSALAEPDCWDELLPEDYGKWIVGFDTAHCGDDLSRWPKEAVQAETGALLRQLLEFEVKPEEEKK